MVQGFFEYLTRDGMHGSVKNVSDTHFQCFCFEKIVIPANALSYLLYSFQPQTVCYFPSCQC